MMSLLLLVAQAAPAQPAVPAPPVTLGPIGRQKLPAKGCAAFVWSVSDRTLVAMATAEPARLRLSVDGKTIDVAQVAQRGTGGLGFGGAADYAGGDVTATLEMTIVTRRELSKGAHVRDALLRVERRGGDVLVVPVAGLIGCA
ncbi:MAG TPA: hypothetical protein VM900_14695 [Sphingomonas sp.]|jgi:hypothetical protein|nr:hypothetical protein [Sphingomonas sp.]